MWWVMWWGNGCGGLVIFHSCHPCGTHLPNVRPVLGFQADGSTNEFADANACCIKVGFATRRCGCTRRWYVNRAASKTCDGCWQLEHQIRSRRLGVS